MYLHYCNVGPLVQGEVLENPMLEGLSDSDAEYCSQKRQTIPGIHVSPNLGEFLPLPEW